MCTHLLNQVTYEMHYHHLTREDIFRFLNNGIATDIFGILSKLSEKRETLLKKKDLNGNTALIKAGQNGFFDLIGFFIAYGADLKAQNSIGSTALIEAINNGHLDVVPLLMASRTANNLQDKSGINPLILACLRGYDTIVTALLDAWADVHAKDNLGNNALFYASREGRKNVIPILLEAGCDVNEQGTSGSNPLAIAACFGHSDVVSLLIEAGADVNQRDSFGKSILSNICESFNDVYAEECQGGLTKMLSILISYGVKVNSLSTGLTVLMEAVERRNKKMVGSLIELGVDVNYKNLASGTTALMVAMKVGCSDIITALISAGANVNAYDKDGMTALMMASHDYNVALLLEAGADVFFKNMDGKTAVDLVWSCHIRDVFRAHVDKLISDSSTTIPKSFVCPITQVLMTDPVICSDGHSYERTCILRWFETKNTSPITNAALDNKTLIPNHALRSSIQEFLAEATKRASLKKKKHVLKDKTNSELLKKRQKRS